MKALKMLNTQHNYQTMMLCVCICVNVYVYVLALKINKVKFGM